MTFRDIREIQVNAANRYSEWAVERLTHLQAAYRKSGLDGKTVTARVQTIQARIDAIRAAEINLNALPWSED